MGKKSKLVLAKRVSILFSPLIWISFGVGRIFWAAFKDGLITQWQLAVLFWVTILFPLAFFLISVKRKRFDLDLTHREKRFRFYVFAIGCGFLGLNLAYIFSEYLFRIFLVFTITGLIFMLITFWDKISLHVGGLTSFYLVLNLTSRWYYFYFIPIIFLVGWSRVVLKKHSLAQVLEGFLVPLLIIPSGFFLLKLI